jgi:hypothetical protein
MPRTLLKQTLRSSVKSNLKGLRSDIGNLKKCIQQGKDSTDTLIRLFQFLPHEMANIFDQDQTLKIQQEHQSGPCPKRSADIRFPNQLQEELWKLNLVSFTSYIIACELFDIKIV